MYVFIDVTRDGRTQLTARKQRMHREYTSVFRACLWHPLGAASAARDFFITLILERYVSDRGRKRFNSRTALHAIIVFFFFVQTALAPIRIRLFILSILFQDYENLGRALFSLSLSYDKLKLATINFSFKFLGEAIDFANPSLSRLSILVERRFATTFRTQIRTIQFIFVRMTRVSTLRREQKY